MWKELRNSVKKWWDNISAERLTLFLVIDGIMGIIALLMSMFLSSIWLVIIGDMLIIIGLLLWPEVTVKRENKRKRKQEEDEKRHKEERKNRIKNIFKGRDKIEVRLVPRNIYPYYAKTFYNELGNLIFLHMLVFVQEKREFKCYAEWENDTEVLILSIVTGNGGNNLNDKRVFDEFPQELFLKYFEPV